MKRKVLIILMTAVLFSSCSLKKDNKEQISDELNMIKKHFSAIYKIALLNKSDNKKLLNNEENIAATSVGISFSLEGNERQYISFDKNHYYIKECLKNMESLRVALSDEGIDIKLINGLDNSVNKMAHNMNENNVYETMRAANDGIYIIGAIAECHNKQNNADILKLEYCLNLIETESENRENLNNAVELTKTVIAKIAASAKQNKKEWKKILKSLESIKSASIYSDGQLIRMKVGIIREAVNKIYVLE